MSAPSGAPAGPVRRRLHQLPTAAVITVLVTGLAGVSANHWRKGAIVIGGAPVLAALLRLLLPAREVGPLIVRSRAFDVVLYLVVGSGVVGLAKVLPTYYHAHF